MALLPYDEENFGVLTDDDLYLDCVFVKPARMADKDLKVLRVWVPKYPLTKDSVLTCARQEVRSYGPDGKIAHLVFDLRGTGDSDGISDDYNYQLDLRAIAAWAQERFGDINFGFLGYPTSEHGRVHMWPLSRQTVMESYYYPGATAALTPPCVLYLSTYGNFSRHDDAHCEAIAAAGFDVYGLDPLRYLLHASVEKRLTPEDLWQDIRMLIQMLPNDPYLVAQPLASGLALLIAAGVEKVQGVVAIGRAQAGLAPSHIFDLSNGNHFNLRTHLGHIAPRPVILVKQENHPMGGSQNEMNNLLDWTAEPHKQITTTSIDADFIRAQLTYLQAQSAEAL